MVRFPRRLTIGLVAGLVALGALACTPPNPPPPTPRSAAAATATVSPPIAPPTRAGSAPTPTLMPTPAQATRPVAAATPAAATPAAATAVAKPSSPAPATPTSASAPQKPTAGTAPASLAQVGGHLYFLRGGALWRHDVAAGQAGRLVDGVADYALSPDGTQLALVRGQGAASQIWVARADGSDPRQISQAGRANTGPTWSSRNVLAFTTSAHPPAPLGDDLILWADWCSAAEVQRWDAAGGVRSLGEGCDPAWAPEGLRLAIAGRPTRSGPQSEPDGNVLRLMNAEGQNAWEVVRQRQQVPTGLDPIRPGHFLYRPTWTPDGTGILYGRFVGYSLACDHSTVERTDSRQGGVELTGRIDWARALSVSANGQYLAADLALCNAPGFGGYNTLGMQVLRLNQPSEFSGFPILGDSPEDRQRFSATRVLQERRAHSAAWSPTGALLAHVQPPDWPGADQLTPDPSSRYNSTEPGELVVRDVASDAVTRIAEGVDFGSPLAWSR